RLAVGMFTLLFALVLGTTGFAQSTNQGNSNQADVSEEQLEQFAAALENVQSIRQEMVEETQGVVADSSLDDSRFQELYRADQGGPAPSEEASDSEQAEYDRIMEDIQQIQEQSNEEMVEAVEEEGLDVQQFNQFAQTIQQNPELQERLQELQS
ncbi:MAG: DUF4168 domain-containing protein, partial [Alkalispirochaetaceae bacterium]